MKNVTADQMRKMFLDFFESKSHKVLPSASLVPHGDASLLLTGAGMVPFKPYFLGQETPDHPRVATCQKCLRTPDIENVGITDRHGTFFEMLGNFSFGDYFKAEVIPWAWEFATEYLEIPGDKIWVTVYHDDDEAYQIWQEKVGLVPDKIVRLGKEDNFWEIGVGYPCGPCSEIHYDRGPEYGCDNSDCKPGCDCERYMEVWNLVFIEYRKLEDDQYEPLAAKSIDTGMGMERMVALSQGVSSIFEIDLVRPILDKVAALAGTTYGASPKNDISLRVITDHIRSVTFLVSDGVLPSNEGRGYVLRRLLRRAARHGKLLGIENQFLLQIVDVVIEQMQVGYPELVEKRDYIDKVINLEEQRFHETLHQGIVMLQDIISDLESRSETIISGENVFRLYDTYGFPVDLTREIVAEHGISVDEVAFKQEMEQQRQRARAAVANKGYKGKQIDLYNQLRQQVESTFTGYDQTECSSKIAAIIKDDQLVEALAAGEEGIIILPETPFYAESGGQVSDNGTLTSKQSQFHVNDVTHPVEGIIGHKGQLISGTLTVGDQVLATVYYKERLDIARHHTATHLLHHALRKVLGDHVNQSGSYVGADRLRFDITHFEAITEAEIFEVEKLVNEAIMANNQVITENTDFDTAKTKGAIALFGEKYGNEVRVVSMGDSIELCGGTHVSATGDIGLFRIVSEGSVAAGVRRIEAVSGKRALEYTDDREQMLRKIAKQLGTQPERTSEQVERLLEQQKNLEQEVLKFKQSATDNVADQLVEQAQEINGANLVISEVQLVDAHDLRRLGDQLRDKLEPAIIFLGARTEGKVMLLGMASKSVVAKGVHVGKVIKEAAKICGGGGGGRPDMAQAGGKQPEKLQEALDQATKIFVKQLEEK